MMEAVGVGGAMLSLILLPGLLASGTGLGTFSLALPHLPGFGLVPGLACGLVGMGAAMLRLPLSPAMLAGLLLAGEGLSVDPQIVVTETVTVATVVIARFVPAVATKAPAVANQVPASSP